MDLDKGWEKKALIVLAIVTIIITVYAYGSSPGTPDSGIQNQEATPAAAMPANNVQSTVPATNNTTINNTTLVTNGTFQISAEQAKKIASQPGYTTGQPTKGIKTINNNNISVWIVPLMKGSIISKEIYVDSTTGIIVGTSEIKP